MMNINDDNYELWLVRYAEQELGAAERGEVERWLASHPDAAEELRLYGEAPHLEKDEAVRHAATVRYVATLSQHTQRLWPLLLRWTAAAAVVAALMVPALLPKEEAPTLIAAVQEEAIKPLKPLRPLEPLEPLKPLKPLRPLEPLKPLKPLEPLKPLKPLKPLEPTFLTPEPATLLLPEEPQQLIYVDNLFTVDSGDAFERQLVALADSTRERLQGTYVGRRLARRLPSDDELLTRTEQVPPALRMMADMVLAYNESNK